MVRLLLQKSNIVLVSSTGANDWNNLHTLNIHSFLSYFISLKPGCRTALKNSNWAINIPYSKYLSKLVSFSPWTHFLLSWLKWRCSCTLSKMNKDIGPGAWQHPTTHWRMWMCWQRGKPGDQPAWIANCTLQRYLQFTHRVQKTIPMAFKLSTPY